MISWSQQMAEAFGEDARLEVDWAVIEAASWRDEEVYRLSRLAGHFGRIALRGQDETEASGVIDGEQSYPENILIQHGSRSAVRQ